MKNSAAGPHTIAAPTAGSIEQNVITTPHSKAASIPSIQKVTPPIVPWIIAMMMLPLTVALTTDVNFPSSLFVWSSLRGIAAVIDATSFSPSRNRKNSRYINTPAPTTKLSVVSPILTTRPAIDWPVCMIAWENLSLRSGKLPS